MDKQPICPYCNEVYDIDKNESYFLYSDNDDYHELNCDKCEKDFLVEVIIKYTFKSAKDSKELYK
jgi:hypothetical protein